jgi:hypothetical protein
LAMKDASPTMNAGNRTCQPITYAHCKQER